MKNLVKKRMLLFLTLTFFLTAVTIFAVAVAQDATDPAAGDDSTSDGTTDGTDTTDTTDTAETKDVNWNSAQLEKAENIANADLEIHLANVTNVQSSDFILHH